MIMAGKGVTPRSGGQNKPKMGITMTPGNGREPTKVDAVNPSETGTGQMKKIMQDRINKHKILEAI
jgi:hypothetical protein